MAEVLNLGIGAGTNSSEAFDLNTPNPFAISQDYMNKAIAMREKSLARDVENEKERQERLDDFLSKVDSIDPKWANANLELNNEINKYGDQIAEYRAQGKPLTKEFYKQINQAQRSIKDKAAINEKNFTKYSQIMSEMAAHPELYSKEDIDAFENQITKAYEKEDGGIIAAEPILSSWQKIIGPINVVESYIKGNFLPQSKDKTGYLKATDEKDFKNSINSYWDSLTMPQRKKIYEQYVRDGRIDSDKVAGIEGQVDQDVMKKLIEEDVRPKMEYDKTPYPVRSGGGDGTNKQKIKINAESREGKPGDTMYKITLSDLVGGNPESSLMDSNYSGKVEMFPRSIEYLDETQVTGKNKPGWYITGQKTKSIGSKEVKAGESLDAQIDSYSAANNLNKNDVTAKVDGNTITFYKLEDAIVPYNRNVAAMKNYGVNSLEQIAADNNYSKLPSSNSNKPEYSEEEELRRAQVAGWSNIAQYRKAGYRYKNKMTQEEINQVLGTTSQTNTSESKQEGEWSVNG
jgi:hypothetical protein